MSSSGAAHLGSLEVTPHWRMLMRGLFLRAAIAVSRLLTLLLAHSEALRGGRG